MVVKFGFAKSDEKSERRVVVDTISQDEINKMKDREYTFSSSVKY